MKILVQYLKLCLVFLAVFELSRLYFICYNASYFKGNSLALSFLETAWNGIWLDLSTIAYCVSPFLLLWLLETVFRKKSPVWITITLLLAEFFLIFMITIADTELFIQWGNKFNNQVLVYVTHPLEMAISAGSTNWGKTLLFSVFFLACMFLLFKVCIKLLEFNREFKYSQVLAIVLVCGLNIILLRGGVGIATISQSSAIYSGTSVNNAASVNSLWNAVYYVVNNTETIYGKWYVYTDEANARRSFEEQIGSDDSALLFSKSERPNVLIVILESFTASGSEYFSGHNNCMPNLDNIARENLSFMQCYASGDRTDKGLVAILSGYPAQPSSSIIVFPDKVAKLPGIGKVLQPLGYEGSFIYGGDAEYAAMKSYLLLHGITNIVDKKDFSKEHLNSKWGVHDGFVFDKAIDVIGQVKQPFFSVVLTVSSHEPFDVPYKSGGPILDDWYPFKNSIRYADHCLNEFLETCKKQAWYDNTLIVLVADHGHEIGLTNTFYFGKEKYHIPLVILGGALDPAFRNKRIEQVISQTAIPSLLFGAMRIPAPGFRWQTGLFDPNGFAQYHYNNGFGRVTSRAEGVSDNPSGSYYFRGEKADSLKLKHDGKIFQQVLIDDFLRK